MTMENYKTLQRGSWSSMWCGGFMIYVWLNRWSY